MGPLDLLEQPTNKIEEKSVPGTEGMNSFRRQSYGCPCPPGGTHRYFFKAYALDTKLALNPNSKKKDVEKAMQGHILAQGELIGIYKRKQQDPSTHEKSHLTT